MPELASRVSNTRPSVTMALIRRAAELRAEGKQVTSLIAGEPDFNTPEHIRAAGIEAIKRGDTRYTAGDGTNELRAALVDKLRRENGLEYASSEVVAANGTKPLLQAAFLALADPGDEVIVPAPYWVSYPDIVRLCGAVPVPVVCTQENGFLLQPEDLEAAITERTRAVLINTPNNPTGAVYDAELLRKLHDVLQRHPAVTVVTDEIYEHLTYDGLTAPSPASVGEDAKARTIVINGFSKGYVMMGWRLGFAAGPANLIKGMSSVLSHLAGSPNSISQAAAVEALRGDNSYQASNRDSYVDRRDLALSMVNQMPGLEAVRTSGSFFVFANCAGTLGRKTPAGETINSDEDFSRLAIDEAGVLVVPGSGFGLSPFLRMSYSVDLEDLRGALERLRKFCNRLS
ncbi:aspartate aminotransferase [Rhodobium orientis]|uniref:Aminotransferase n=1 Tax=Rhodobium orientis TaxID=34017 RepID=A0A327JZ09_9HYPH|nr:pyridoxal phosphate-dependent aminotransferase [Rhodobium orientis]MBB4301061.1 aspartate aminotransferase [Rhodobium orientis]MBK5949729.1 aspartate aminotransferase [Rhodobium orientis]RAI30242.1 aspartate aminotransferase [Rhodobium orientis]